MAKSEQATNRKRNPERVDINYVVKGGTKKVRIPFRAGVMGNFSGHTEDLPPLMDREFVKIDKFNFDKVMEGMNVSLNLNVQDTTTGNPDDQFNVALQFKKWDDFHPSNLIMQVPRLKTLYEERKKLLAAKTTLEKSPKAEKHFTGMLKELDGDS